MPYKYLLYKSILNLGTELSPSRTEVEDVSDIRILVTPALSFDPSNPNLKYLRK